MEMIILPSLLHFINILKWWMENCVYYYAQSLMDDHHISHLSQVGGNLDGKFDEGSANLILDTKPSKVVSNELTVS